MKQEIVNWVTNNQHDVRVYSALAMGTLMQIIYTKQQRSTKFIMYTITSSTFLYFYIIFPLLSYFGKVDSVHLHVFLASVSGLLSVVGITVIIEWLPSQLKEKARGLLGLSQNNAKAKETNYYDDYR